MSTLIQTIKRNAFGATALLMLASTFVPLILASSASAALVTNRKITMSSAAQSASAVSYEVSFTSQSAYDLDGLVVQFCNDSPIIGSTACTGTAGTEVPSTASVGTSVTVTGAPNGTWTAAAVDSNRGVKITNASGTNNQVANTTVVTFTLTGIVNPSDLGTFYARIYTFDTAGEANSYAVATPGTPSDSGGIALSTTESVQVSATVQETLTFCVSKADPSAGCTSTTPPNVTLGTGTPIVLDTLDVYEDSIFMQTSTNASSGVVVNMKGASGNLTSGSSIIPAKGALGAILAGTAGFGMRLDDSTNSPAGNGQVLADAYYKSSTGDNAAMNDSAVTSTYGDTIASSTGPLLDKENTLTFAATAGATTAAGVYTAAFSLIAVGQY